MDLIEKVEPLPEELDPKAIPSDLDREGDGKIREIVLGRNVHTSCFEIMEPEADDEVTGDREAYMASVLARYRRSLTERTKHHLGMRSSSFLLVDLANCYVNKKGTTKIIAAD